MYAHMRRVPKPINSRIRFFQSRLSQWVDHASEIGVSSEDVDAFVAMVDEARAAYSTQVASKQAAQAATSSLRSKVATMSNMGAVLIRQIEAKARMSDGGVYPVARLSAPKAATPIKAPGTPFRFTAQLQGDGALLLKWDCKNPRGSVGTIYEVRRRIGVGGEMVYLGNVGVKKFVDNTLPPAALAAGSLVYQIAAVRSKRRGSAAEFPVPIGGGMKLTSMKVAA
jgi:hypothetical protein